MNPFAFEQSRPKLAEWNHLMLVKIKDAEARRVPRRNCSDPELVGKEDQDKFGVVFMSD